MTSPVVPEPVSAAASRLWREITVQVREVCILRRQGRHGAATSIFENELPTLLRSWFSECGLPAPDAKDRLSRLFEDEQARVESNWMIARFLANESPDVAAHTRRLIAFAPDAAPGMWFPAIGPSRIRIDDVNEMIDAARESARPAPCFP